MPHVLVFAYDLLSWVFGILIYYEVLILNIGCCKLQQGQHISLLEQIQQFTDTYQQFILSMGEHRAADLISNSVFYLSVGINDYIHYYLRNVSNVQNLYLPWNFNQFLASTIWQQIKVIFLVFVFLAFNNWWWMLLISVPICLGGCLVFLC